MKKVYHLGYSAKEASENIASLMENENVLLIDTRLKPYSRRPEWQGAMLKNQYGARYRQAGNCLGNLNYKGGPIKIVDLTRGVKGLTMYLSEGHDLILLCQCNHDGCHRYDILKALDDTMPDVEVIGVEESLVSSSTIACLSIRQPYASWLSHPEWFINAQLKPKCVENRDWTTRHRGRTVFQASETFEKTAIPFWTNRYPELKKVIPLKESDYPRRCLVGEAVLEKVITQSDPEAKDPWFSGRYGFLFSGARAIAPTITYPGALKVFRIPESILHKTMV